MEHDTSQNNSLECKELEIINSSKTDSKNIQHTQRRPGGSGGSNRPGGPGGPGGPNRPGGPGGPGGPNRPGGPGGPGFPFPGGPGFPNNIPGYPNVPNNMFPPTMPPPSTSPQLPRGVVIPAPETSQFNQMYNNTSRSNNLQWEFRRCLNQFTFIWLWNGRSFWFFPVFVNNWFAEGFAWRGNRWVYDRINLNSIFFFRCF